MMAAWCFIYFIVMAFSVISINVRSVYGDLRSVAVLDYLKSVEADIVCVQECGIPFNVNWKKLEERWGCGETMWSGSNENRNDGVGILIKNRNIRVMRKTVLVDGRAISMSFSFLDKEFNLFNVYAPADKNERGDLLNVLRSELLSTRSIILAGDFNTVLDCSDREPGKDRKIDKTSNLLKEILKDFSLIDGFKAANLAGKGFTWASANNKFRSRIDFIFFSKDLKCVKFSLVPVFFSDHLMLSCRLEFKSMVSVGKGVWKLNVQLLEDERIRKEFLRKYEGWQTLKGFFSSIVDWWEWMKGNVKSFFIQEGRKKAERSRRLQAKLQRELQSLYRLGREGFECAEEIKEVKDSLREVFEERSKSIIFKSRVEYVEKNEKCTRFFFKKVLGKDKCFEGLKDGEGVLKKGTEEVKKVAETFYSELYEQKGIDEGEVKRILEGMERVVCLEDCEGLARDLSEEELTVAMKSFKLNKTPGNDGLPIEFYSSFWEVIKKDLFEVLRCIANSDKMPRSFRVGIITLLYKKGEREELKNWRPVSLQNVDYKLWAKVITLRLRSVIGSVIHPDQVCAVPGRKIADSLILMRDTIQFMKERMNKLCILNLDLEKAYDRIAHEYMFMVLRKMGFPRSFINWIKCLYEDIGSRVIINGELTEVVRIKSGVRQGCPLSPLLFICCIEPLGNLIRADRLIDGVHIPGGGGLRNKCMMYMDDVTVSCTDELSVRRVLQHTESFCQASGSKLNVQKSECMLYGKWEEPPQVGLCFKKDFIKILGVKFDCLGSGVKNWEDVVGKVSQKIGLWGMRELTLQGRVLVLKAVIVPLLLYVSVVFPPPRNVLLLLIRKVMYFFWRSKCERAKRTVLYKGKEFGGIGMPDLNLILWLKFVCMHLDLCLFKKNKTSCFVRFYLGGILRGLKMYKPVLTQPVAWEAPFFYNGIKKFLINYEICTIETSILKEYKTVLKIVLSRTEICPVRWVPHDVVRRIWKDVSHPSLLNPQKDLVWQVAHDILPVRMTMYRRFLAKSPRCPRSGCGAEESAYHLLWDCEHAKVVWQESSELFGKHTSLKALNSHVVVFGVKIQEMEEKKWITLMILLSCFKYALWKARCLLVLKGKDMSRSDTKRLALFYLKGYYFRDVHARGAEYARDRWKVCL